MKLLHTPVTILVTLTLSSCTLIPSLSGSKKAGEQKSKPLGPDQGMAGELHKANKGKLVFASAAIPRDAAGDHKLSSSFKLGEPIYARGYFATSAAHAMARANAQCKYRNAGTVELTVSIDDGKPLVLASTPSKEKWREWTTMIPGDGAVLPTEKIRLPLEKRSDGLALDFASLADGPHTVSLHYRAYCTQKKKIDLASGQFTLVVDAAGRTAALKNVVLAKRGLTTDPAETKRLEQAAVAYFNEATVLHFRPIEYAKRIIRKHGVQTHRQIMAVTLLKDDKGCVLRASVVKEQYAGAGDYGAPRFMKPMTVQQDQRVPCNINVAD